MSFAFILVSMIKDGLLLQSARNEELEKKFGCVCLRSGPLHVAVRLSKMGYVPGEAVCMEARINNATTARILSTKCVLTQVCIFRAVLSAP